MRKHAQILCIFITAVIVISGLSNANSIVNIYSNSTENESPSKGMVIQDVKPYKILDVPYEDMIYDPYYGDAAACLSMLSEYYGDKVDKLEINPIVGADYLGGGGISMEGFIDAAEYDDYSTRDYGYYVKTSTLDDKTHEERWCILRIK
jgi:hypothetical protein